MGTPIKASICSANAIIISTTLRTLQVLFAGVRFFIEILALVVARAFSYLSCYAVDGNLVFWNPHQSVGTIIQASIRILIAVVPSATLRTHDVLACQRIRIEILVLVMAHACSYYAMAGIEDNICFELKV